MEKWDKFGPPFFNNLSRNQVAKDEGDVNPLRKIGGKNSSVENS